MKIKKIEIVSFGGLSNVTVIPGDGLTVIEGKNESGKSSILSFIRYMLYGLPKRSGEAAEREYTAAIPWQSGVIEGSLTVYDEYTNKEYIIHRRGSEDDRDGFSERCETVDAQSKMTVFKGKAPGEMLLGVPLSVFDSTAAVRQQALGNMSGEALSSSIENMLYAADENVNVKQAKVKLNNARKHLKLERGRGGRIHDLMLTRDGLVDRLEKAQTDGEALLREEATAKKYLETGREAKENLAVAEKKCRTLEAITVLKLFSILHESEANEKRLSEEKEGLISSSPFAGGLPSRADADELRALGRTHAEHKSRLFGAWGTLERLSATAPKLEYETTVAKITEVGGREKLCERFLEGYNKAKKQHKLGCLLAIFIVGIFMIIRAKRMMAELSAYASEFGYEGCDPEGFSAHIDRILNAHSQAKAYYDMIDLERRTLTETEGEYAETCQSIREHLKTLYGRETECENDVLGEAAERAADDACDLLDRYNAASAEYERCHSDVCEHTEDLSVYDEAEIRESIDEGDVAALSGESLPALQDQCKYWKQKLSASEIARVEAEKRFEVLRKTTENASVLSAKLEETEEALRVAEARYSAILMATDAIERASVSLRSSVTPKLGERAGELMERTTEGRYRGFKLGDDMSISVETESGLRGAESLSGGTGDAAYFALRTALCSMLYTTSKPPLLLDEALSQMDDGRAERLLSMLCGYAAEGRQTLLFTCHSRERRLLNAMSAPFEAIEL